MDGNYESYIISLGEIIKEYALEAKKNKDLSIGTKNEQFATGYLSGFHRIVTLMQQQAEIYDISLEEISLDKLNEIDLI
jgi:hypothetical protein